MDFMWHTMLGREVALCITSLLTPAQGVRTQKALSMEKVNKRFSQVYFYFAKVKLREESRKQYSFHQKRSFSVFDIQVSTFQFKQILRIAFHLGKQKKNNKNRLTVLGFGLVWLGFSVVVGFFCFGMCFCFCFCFKLALLI